MPSHEASALKQGVDSDWRRNASASASSSARVGACTCAASNARRSGDVLTSPSAARSSGGNDAFIECRTEIGGRSPWQRIGLRVGKALHRLLHAFLVAQA